MERGRRKVAASAIECGDRDAAEESLRYHHRYESTCPAQHEYHTIEVGVASHRQRSRHDEKSGATHQCAIAIDEREHRSIQ